MVYMGSKSRFAEALSAIMLEARGDRVWVEPFVGGGNMIETIDGERIGADSNPNAIAALVMIRDAVEELPKNNKEFTEADYNRIKSEAPSPLRAFAGFVYSFGSKWFGGWARDPKGGSDYVERGYRAALKQSPRLQGVELVCSSYADLILPEKSLIYCDPPYCNTTGYGTTFDSSAFWQWCRDKSNEGHILFVSEYEAPPDFVEVFSTETRVLIDGHIEKISTERLFTHKVADCRLVHSIAARCLFCYDHEGR